MIMYIQRLLLGIKHIRIFTILLFVCELQAQSFIKENNFEFLARGQRGFIWEHSPSVKPLIDENVYAANIEFGYTTTGKKGWEMDYRLPAWGLGLTFMDLGNPKLAGEPWAIYNYFRSPVISFKRIKISYQMAAGLAWLNKKHPEIPENKAISMHMNAYLNVGADIKISVSPQIGVVAGAGIIHFSNGRIKTPNAGINVLASNLGIRYSPQKNPAVKKRKAPQVKKNEWCIIMASGLKENAYFMPGTYLVHSLSSQFLRTLTSKRKIGTGIDVFYDTSILDELHYKGDKKTYKNIESIRTGMHISQEMLIGRLSLVTQMGVYLYRGIWKKKDLFYNRFGLKYKIREHWYTNLTLKTHPLAIADFFELGIGYAF